MSFTNFYTFYNDIVGNIIKYNGSKLLNKDIRNDSDKIKEVHNAINIDTEIELIKGRIKKETQFNRQMEMNMQIKELEQKRELIINKLD